MLFDFNEAWSRLSDTRYDVCICGSGPAGITVARKLASHGKKVLLLEAGGLDYSDQSQDHYRGRNVGRTFWLETSRLRYLGGTSNHWAGQCAVPNPSSFEPQEFLGLPGWPIAYQDFVRHLDEAKEIVDIAGADLSEVQQPGFPTPWFDKYGSVLSPPTRFFQKYGDEIRQSQQIDAFYNANLIDLRLSDNHDHLQSLRVQNYNGKTVDVSAPRYVLALGGIENVRLLLNANKQVPAGIGNHSDMVGRCFMESLNVPIGRFLVTDPDFWRSGVALVPTVKMMQEHGISNGAIVYTPNISADRAFKSFGRLHLLRKFVHQTGCITPAITELARHFVNFDCPGDGQIGSIIEQEPNPESRIRLIDEVDSLGLRRVQMNWQLCDADLKTVRVISLESAKEMARLNKARVQLSPFILDTKQDMPASGFGHHMGTTRMSADPRHGVVDGDCKVHGIENLYIGGSSVFAKCGGRNPTLSIVLLSLRLGELLATLPAS